MCLAILILILILILVLIGCSESSKKEAVAVTLTISAASSLQDVLEAITVKFHNKYPNMGIRYNFGASGSLVTQIEQGAPVDLFLSASNEKFKELVVKELVQENATFISNELVMITALDKVKHLSSVKELNDNRIEKISIGTPSIVPAGDYAKQALDYFNLWNEIENKMVFAKDVRQVLTYVETKNVDAGFVYKTDAIHSTKVKIVETIDDESHHPITYPVGIIKDTKNYIEAKKFYEFIQSEEVKDIWIKYGFTFIQ